jgi:hypothetical protein
MLRVNNVAIDWKSRSIFYVVKFNRFTVAKRCFSYPALRTGLFKLNTFGVIMRNKKNKIPLILPLFKKKLYLCSNFENYNLRFL